MLLRTSVFLLAFTSSSLLAFATTTPDADQRAPSAARYGGAASRMCAAEPRPEYLAHLKELQERDRMVGKLRKRQARTAPSSHYENITVPMFFHLVVTSAEQDAYNTTQLALQYLLVKAYYAQYNITIYLAGADKVVYDTWANDQADAQMKYVLHKGNYQTLNIYFQSNVSDTLGRCTFPAQYLGNLTTNEYFTQDGCNIWAPTLPGGEAYGYNEGKTCVHEIGHWFGLLHTFQGYNCTGNGDYIDDTPPEAIDTDGCPVMKNTCPRAAGDTTTMDPIHNFMDYSSDECYNQFTPDQVQRMFDQYDTYRRYVAGFST